MSQQATIPLLQRLIGNRAVGQLLAPRSHQLQRVAFTATQQSQVDPRLAVPTGADTAAPQQHLGTYVDQDAAPFIGQGLAHTSNLETCTALSMYSHQTGLAFLYHASSLSVVDTIVTYIWNYMERLRQALDEDESQDPIPKMVADDMEIWVFTPPGHQTKSPDLVRAALTQIDGGEGALVRRAHYQEMAQAKAGQDPRLLYQINKGVRVVVGSDRPRQKQDPLEDYSATYGGPRLALPAKQRIDYYSQAYIAAPSVESATTLLEQLEEPSAAILQQTGAEDYRVSVEESLKEVTPDLLTAALEAKEQAEQAQKGELVAVHEKVFQTVRKLAFE